MTSCRGASFVSMLLVMKIACQFLDVFEDMIGWGMLSRLCSIFVPRPRGAWKLEAQKLVSALIFHQLQEGGTLADSVTQLHGIQ